MCPNELLSERGRFNPIFFFLFLFTTSIAFAQKEQFVGFELGSAKYIDEKAKGTSIGVFYEIKNSPYWIFGLDFNYSFVDALPKGLNIGSTRPLQYLDEVNNYFVGTSTANVYMSFFSNRDLHATLYANFVIPFRKLEIIPAIGIGYGHISTIHFSLISWTYDSKTNLIAKVNDFSTFYWHTGVLNVSPKIRLLYKINNKTAVFFVSKILLNAAYKSNGDFDLGYTGTWSHNLGIRIKI